MINASLAGVIEEARESALVDRIIGMRRGIEGLLAGELVDLTSLTTEEIEALAYTPGSALGACRRKVTEDEVDICLKMLDAEGVEMLCYIGGNDSADTTLKLSNASRHAGSALRAVAVPKTIDNDLPHTDHCPGYGSVARYVAVSTAESTLDTRSLPTNYPVKIIEVMGRDAGWLAASSGLARRDEMDGPHLIYVPELSLDVHAFLESVREIHGRFGYAVVVVAETIRDAKGESIATDVAFVDEFGHPILRGAADTLARLVTKELGLTARTDKPGTLQRSSRVLQSSVDVREAREVGRAAVRLLASGQTGRMVTIDRVGNEPYESTTSSASISDVANKQRLLPREFLDDEGTSITDAFRAYAMPLLGPTPLPEWFKF